MYEMESQCYNCPALRDSPKAIFDRTRKLYNDKKKWYSSLKDLTVIGVSDWITEQAKESILNGRKCIRIYNWINTDIFKPYNENILNKYSIDSSKFTIIGVSSHWTKGSPKYEDFMKLADLIDDSMQILLIGNAKNPIVHQRVVHIPFVKDSTELAKLYSSSNVYVHFSTEDTFGKVIAEAMACGIPSIVYNSTGCPELMKNGCGFVVSKRNVNEALQYILQVKAKPKEYYLSNCISHVLKEFNYDKNVNELIQLYENIINKIRK